ncbi:MAG TPA: lamin tail domain-containing protein, partial [Sphingobacteriaceae bacterium]
MKKCLLIFLLLLSKTALSQLQDDFADDNFTINPVWTGSNAGNDFVITSQQLRSNSLVASSNFYLSTPSSLATHCRWEFWVNLKFATSGANYVDIYLISDTADLQSPEIDGYFVRIGNTDDEVSLYKRTGTSATYVKLIDGINGSVGSSNNVIRVRVTRTASGQFKLERDKTGSGTSYLSEGEAQDTTVMTSAAFGIFIQQSNSTTFFQNHFFDDFRIEPLITDTIPPKILSARAIDSLTLAITFSEPVDSAMAVLAEKYALDPSIPLATIAGTSDPLIYNLTLGQNLQTGSYTLSADGIRDKVGNVMISRDSATFTYTAPYEVRVGDVVINEIFADPSPQIDLPSVEYIELYNTTDQNISLKNWKYRDATSSYTFEQDSIKSQEHLILCARADTAEFKKFGRVIGISPWPSLNNAGDSLRLVNEKGILISEVSYTSSWYRNLEKRSGGWSLELLDPFSNCQGITAWAASIDSTGGTPGRINSVFARLDSVNFRFEEVSILTDTTLQILINKPLDPNALDKVQFMITPPVGSTVKPELDITLQQLKLTFDDPFAAGTDYSIQSALPDCDGNNWVIISFKTAALPPPLPARTDTARIVINEIFADPSPEIGLPLIEFVEIYNPGKDTINLTGWSMADSTSKGTVKVGAILPGGFAILCPLADTVQFQKYGNTIGISPWPALNNSGEKIRLSSFTGRKVDSVAFNDSWYKDGLKKQGGWSLERLDPLSKCNGNTSWAASVNMAGGTPGGANSVFQPNYEQTPWKVDSLQLLSDTSLVLFLNRPLDPSWLQAKAFTLQPAAGNLKHSLNVTQTQLKLTSDEKFAAGTSYTLEFGFMDCTSTLISLTTAFKTPALPLPPPVRTDDGEIIITEIFADPSPEVGLPLAEFIEVFNPGKEPIDLSGWILSDPTVKSVIKKGLIAPSEYVILCPASDTLQYQTFGKTIGLAPWPSLNNGSDQIVLQSFTKRMVDSVAYRDSWYQDSAKVEGGWSLELINLTNDCPGKSNWLASKDPRGGTPGRENSVAGMAGSNEPFQLLHAKLKDSVSVLLTFSKPLDSLPAADVSNYQLNNGAG